MKRLWVSAAAVLVGALCALVPAAAAEDIISELVPGTAVLLDQSTGSGSGGNSKSTSTSTNIFAPATYVDYKRFGGEPTVAVDRYPFTGAPDCAPNPAPCFKDLVYQSAPNGLGSYSQFWKSDDLGQTFRKPRQFPLHGQPQTTLPGGGDSHQDVGSLTHDVYFIDLTLACITMNVSTDLGETFRTDPFGCGLSFLDDRQWVEADEAVNKVYVSTINLSNAALPAVAVYINVTGAPTGGFAASPCNPATFDVGANPIDPALNDQQATPCPDPADQYLWVAGPVVADEEGTPTRAATHNVYVPFVRRISQPLGTGLFGIDAWKLYVAKSTDNGQTWKRYRVADLPNTVNPANIFVQLTIDRGGNLYYTWSQAQGASTTSHQSKHEDTGSEEDTAGEQDIYYAFSTTGAMTWSPPINLTPENNDSAIFPWMKAGDPGRVDLVYYKANNGVNSNVAPPDTVWNVYFAQSMNALNTGSNFNSVQVSTQPNHIGVICTGGLGCDEDRDLLDFFTVDVDHLGAAHIAYSDDNWQRNTLSRDRMTRQIAGNSVYKNQNITLQSAWPIRDHAVTDRLGDDFDTGGVPKGSCPGMDVSKLSASRFDDKITINLTLNGAPTSGKATACGGVAATGGFWGAEFWARSATSPPDLANHFWIAYRDDTLNGPRAEVGDWANVNTAVTSLEPRKINDATLTGDCFTGTPPTVVPTTNVPCTISITALASSLGITPGNGLYNLTGLSVYFFGDDTRIPGTRVITGNTEQADATAPFHYLGSGTP